MEAPGSGRGAADTSSKEIINKGIMKVKGENTKDRKVQE